MYDDAEEYGIYIYMNGIKINQEIIRTAFITLLNSEAPYGMLKIPFAHISIL